MDLDRLQAEEGEQGVKSATLFLFIEEDNYSLLESFEAKKKKCRLSPDQERIYAISINILSLLFLHLLLLFLLLLFGLALGGGDILIRVLFFEHVVINWLFGFSSDLLDFLL